MNKSSDLNYIFNKYPLCISYKNICKNSKSWIQQSNVKSLNFLFCKDINDIMICILQAYISFLSIEKLINFDISIDELLNIVFDLPDLNDNMKISLKKKINQLKKDYKESLKNQKDKNDFHFSTQISFDLQNNFVLTFDIKTSQHKYHLFDYINSQKKCSFEPIGYQGNIKTNYVYFYIFEKINDNILYFHFETYKDKLNMDNICDIIESKFSGKLKLRKESKDWIMNSYFTMKNFESELIRLDNTNGFLINNFDFDEDFSGTSFFNIKIYVLNEKKKFEVFIPEPSWIDPNKAIKYIQDLKNNYISYYYFKKSLFYKFMLLNNIKDELKTYLF